MPVATRDPLIHPWPSSGPGRIDVGRSAWGALVAVNGLRDPRDRELVTRIGKGDAEAFRSLFDRYAPNAQALARRIVQQANLAEEIVQEVFLGVWRSPDTYDAKRGSVRAWIMTQVHHRAVDLVRREESQRRRATELAAEPDPRSGPGADDPADAIVEALGAPEERAAVRDALGGLPDAQRTVIEAMYFGGRSQSQVAAELGLPLGTVKSRTLLGMRRLRGALEGMER